MDSVARLASIDLGQAWRVFRYINKETTTIARYGRAATLYWSDLEALTKLPQAHLSIRYSIPIAFRLEKGGNSHVIDASHACVPSKSRQISHLRSSTDQLVFLRFNARYG